MTLTQLSRASFYASWINEAGITARIRKENNYMVIEEVRSKEQGKGHLSAFIKKIVSLGYKVKVESIINPTLVIICEHLNIEYEKAETNRFKG